MCHSGQDLCERHEWREGTSSRYVRYILDPYFGSINPPFPGCWHLVKAVNSSNGSSMPPVSRRRTARSRQDPGPWSVMSPSASRSRAVQDHVPFGLLENDPSHRDAIPEGRTDWVARSGVHQWPADRDAGAHLDPAVVVEVEAPTRASADLWSTRIGSPGVRHSLPPCDRHTRMRP